MKNEETQLLKDSNDIYRLVENLRDIDWSEKVTGCHCYDLKERTKENAKHAIKIIINYL